jgi:hypothetical protein
MDRDDLILRGIADGATNPAALEARTGLTHATVWRGLHQLEPSLPESGETPSIQQ